MPVLPLSTPAIDLCFRLTESSGAFSAEDGRSLLAGQGSQAHPTLPPWLFWRADHTHALTSVPMVRFHGGRRGFGILAIGESWVRALTDLAPRLIEVVHACTGELPGFTCSQHAVSVSLSPSPQYYRIDNLIHTVRTPQWQAYQAASAAERAQQLEQMLGRQIREQAQAYGIASPPAGTGFIRVDDALLADDANHTAARGIGAGGRAGLVIKRLAFTANFDFSDVGWHFGRLRSKGRGRVSRQALPPDVADRLIAKNGAAFPLRISPTDGVHA